MPADFRAHTNGDNMRLLNAEREALHLWRLLPIDMTDDQLAEQRKAKSRKRREAKRRASGVRTKAEYLAELASRPKPWLAEGIHRRTWERRRAAGCVPSLQQTPQASDATILCKAVTHAAALPRAETQRRGLQERGKPKSPRRDTKGVEVEKQTPQGPECPSDTPSERREADCS